MRPTRTAFCLALALTFALCAAMGSPLRAGAADGRLDIYWVDTEGGAATLIVTPAGESVLIDSGNPGGRDPARIAKVAKDVAKLERIDHLVTTHFHIDHFGGAAQLSALLPIGSVYDNGEFKGGFQRPDAAYLNFKAERRVVLNPGDVVPLKRAGAPGTNAGPAVGPDSPPVRLTCVATRQTFIDPPAGAEPNPLCAGAKKKREDYTDNANSIVQVLSFGDFRFFDGGDLTWNVETKLVCPVNLVGRVDVYQVNHHGLDVSNNPVLVKSLAPRVVVVNSGPTKGGQPETAATVRAAESVQAVYQLHRNLTPGETEKDIHAPDEYIANNEPTEQCKANYVKLSVAPDAKSYTVTVPATGHERTFEVRGEGGQK